MQEKLFAGQLVIVRGTIPGTHPGSPGYPFAAPLGIVLEGPVGVGDMGDFAQEDVHFYKVLLPNGKIIIKNFTYLYTA